MCVCACMCVCHKTPKHTIIIIHPLAATVIGVPQMISQPVSSIKKKKKNLFCTALWDLPNSRPVHSLTLSSHLFLCLPYLPPTLTVPWLDLMNGRHDHTTAVCVSLRWSGGLRVVPLPTGA